MARARNLKPGFFTNDQLAECDPLARLLFAGLWTIADREGRLEDRPRKIKAELLPYDDCDVERLLAQLTDRGFIARYEGAGTPLIQIVNFGKHQTPHVKEAESVWPSLAEPNTSTVQVSDNTRSSTPVSISLNPLPSSVSISTTSAAASPREDAFVPAKELPPPPSNYERELADLIPAVAKRWRGINDEWTEPWLREELRRIEADVGPMDQAQLVSGLKLAQQQIERAVKNGGIKSTPRGFAAKVMTDALREQRHGGDRRHRTASPPA